MRALSRSRRRRLLASCGPAAGVALVLAAACLWGLLAGSRARMGDLLFAFEARGWAHLDIGVGINTGQMVVGNMGSKDRLIYTAVGPLRCYEVVARAGALAPAGQRMLARYHDALALYRARRWEETLRLLDELAREAPADGPIALYRRRARALLAAPPSEDWDGVFVAEWK